MATALNWLSVLSALCCNTTLVWTLSRVLQLKRLWPFPVQHLQHCLASANRQPDHTLSTYGKRWCTTQSLLQTDLESTRRVGNDSWRSPGSWAESVWVKQCWGAEQWQVNCCAFVSPDARVSSSQHGCSRPSFPDPCSMASDLSNAWPPVGARLLSATEDVSHCTAEEFQQ